MKEDYLFLRRIEHCLQILEDRQIHTIPADMEEIEALAKRVLGAESNGHEFMDRLHKCLKRVRNVYNDYLMRNHEI